MFKYSVGIKTTLLESLRSQKLFYRLYFGKTNYDDLVFARNDFLRLVVASNEFLILIIIYYIFKYSVGIKITLLESLRSQKVFGRLYFGKTSYNDLVFARNEFLRLVGAPNESLILIIIYYIFKYSVRIKTSLL